jgi:hypothetical protein
MFSVLGRVCREAAVSIVHAVHRVEHEKLRVAFDNMKCQYRDTNVDVDEVRTHNALPQARGGEWNVFHAMFTSYIMLH